MKQKLKFKKIYMKLLIPIMSVTILSGNVIAATADSVVDENCVVSLDPVSDSITTKLNTNEKCYASLSEAISAATNGSVQLPLTATTNDITDTVIAANTSGQAVLGILYKRTKYRGSSLIFTGPWYGCKYKNVVYNVGYVGRRFNDKASSMRVYSSCRAVLYEHVNFRGVTLRVPYSKQRLGIMNNEASSVKFGGNL